MTGNPDAGYKALAGFFYQLAASATLGFRLYSPAKESDGSLDVHFALERFGQDADSSSTLGNSKTIELFQFKYSSDPIAYPIAKPELYEILDAFLKSKKWAIDAGYREFRLHLITNRSLDKNSKSLKSIAETDAKNSELDEPDKAKKSGKRKTIRTANVKKQLRELLGLLRVQEGFDIQDSENELKTRALELGVRTSEFQERYQSLLGYFLGKASSSSRSISKDELNSQLAGFSGARSLLSEAVYCQMVDNLSPFANESSFGSKLASRPVVDDIIASLDRSLVVVVGQGGVGKTTAVFQAVKKLLSGSSSAPPFVIVSTALDVDETWLGAAVSRLRTSEAASNPIDSTEIALERLTAAAESVKSISKRNPIIVLALDALDEVDKAQERRARLRKLLRLFIEKEKQRGNRASQATLIVTCRSRDELDDLNSGGWPHASFTDAIIEVTPFSRSELADAARVAALHPSITYRIEAHGCQSSGGAPSLQKTIDTAVYEAISYPSVWHCFLELTTDEEKHAALSSERESLNTIAELFVDWFCRKAERRVCITRNDIRKVLETVVESLNGDTLTGHIIHDWVTPASSVINGPHANQILKEAISAGVVSDNDVPARHWRWTHKFIYEYLKRCG